MLVVKIALTAAALIAASGVMDSIGVEVRLTGAPIVYVDPRDTRLVRVTRIASVALTALAVVSIIAIWAFL